MVGITVILVSGLAQLWTMTRIDSAWNLHESQAQTRETLLASIKAEFGYRSIIHNYKNYVLRGQDKYVNQIEKNRDAIKQSIEKYRELDLTTDERDALAVIDSFVQKYTEQTSTVKKLWDAKASPGEIDVAVIRDDSPAHDAFKALTGKLTAISDMARSDMEQASGIQIIFMVASFLLLSAVIITAVMTQRSQASAMDELSQTMTDIERNQDFAHRIRTDRTDEVGILTSSFDKLLDNIESMLTLNRAVLDAVPDPIFLSKDGKVVFGNTIAANYAGIHIKDLKGLDDSRVLIPAEGSADMGEYLTCVKDGENVFLDKTVKTVKDKHGTNLGRLVVARDMTMILRRESESKANLEIIREVGNEINSAAQELVGAIENLNARIHTISEGAQTQQERISDTATAMEQMNSTVLEVARNASGAAEMAEQARGKAVEGSDVVKQSIGSISSVSRRADTLKDSMGKLADHTESIGNIINVISDIADQTNLLALNAAIEAARAGETGRGFAIVADEVRKLAEKTMSATKDVAEAIKSIQTVARQNIKDMDSASEAISQATDLAEDSGSMLQAIVQLAEGTTQQINSIATASEEQSASSEEVVAAIAEVNDISNQTAEGMRESTIATKALSDLAQRLDELAAKAG